MGHPLILNREKHFNCGVKFRNLHFNRLHFTLNLKSSHFETLKTRNQLRAFDFQSLNNNLNVLCFPHGAAHPYVKIRKSYH
ncbi:hypothetical protein DFP86_11751 [Paludibacterium purpuratum]|uniref:Uncharacterized protein n=1 Tax=Paludibacterium purpuratum TaxID=1144873 RepID=A0A4R7AXM0_9NEIS|nr:hypothetical protein DFP86_11751 [Paludibacterium purpuratum]